jgi:hypothetical protein
MLPSQRVYAVLWLILSTVVGGFLSSNGWIILGYIFYIFGALCVWALIKNFFPGF